MLCEELSKGCAHWCWHVPEHLGVVTWVQCQAAKQSFLRLSSSQFSKAMINANQIWKSPACPTRKPLLWPRCWARDQRWRRSTSEFSRQHPDGAQKYHRHKHLWCSQSQAHTPTKTGVWIDYMNYMSCSQLLKVKCFQTIARELKLWNLAKDSGQKVDPQLVQQGTVHHWFF